MTTATDKMTTIQEDKTMPGCQVCGGCGNNHDGDEGEWETHENQTQDDYTWKVLCETCENQLTDAQRVQCAEDGCYVCSELVCEHCQTVSDNTYVHSFGCVRLCAECGMTGGKPYCQGTSLEDDCGLCAASDEDEDEDEESDEESEEEVECCPNTNPCYKDTCPFRIADAKDKVTS